MRDIPTIRLVQELQRRGYAVAAVSADDVAALADGHGDPEKILAVNRIHIERAMCDAGIRAIGAIVGDKVVLSR